MTAISDGCYVLHLLLSSSFSRGAKEQQKGKRNKINKNKKYHCESCGACARHVQHDGRAGTGTGVAVEGQRGG